MYVLLYKIDMSVYIVRITHTRGQNHVGIPKALAIAGGFEQREYVKVWLTDQGIINIEGFDTEGDEKDDVQSC